MRQRRPGRNRRIFERLEPRLFLAGDVLITELMAVNDGFLADKDGDFSDWIELHNTTAEPVDLGGWRLTDSAANPAKWTFPEGATIGPGAYLVVFTSDKNIAVAGQEYHTNFKLTSDGEYLALIDDAGLLVHEYAPEFPEQYTNVSYGISSESTAQTLIDADDSFRYRVPTGPGEDATWMTPGFSDAAWATGSQYLGYETSPDLYASILETIVPGNTTTAYLRFSFDVASPADVPALTLRMKYDDGFVAYLNGVRIASDHAPATLAWNSSATTLHGDNEALVYADFAVANPSSLVVPGANVLAIHGMNYTGNLSDFLIGAELDATLVTSPQAALRYFPAPTPGAANGDGVVGFAAEPVFSREHGFFGLDEDFTLTLQSDTPGAAIYYTLDGSVPSPGNPSAHLFSPASPLYVGGTTVVRAGAFKDDWQPSKVGTQTYLFLNDVIRQNGTPPGWPSGSVNGQVLDYGMDPDIVNNPKWGPQLIDALESIPTFSIVTDLDNLFDPATGMYVNAGVQTPESERPLSLELIHPDGTVGFQIEAGMRIRGNFSASDANPKHAFRLFFREEYGDKRLEYPLFGDDGVDVFEKLDLRCAQNDSWAFMGSNQLTYVHDVFSRDNLGLMGQPTTQSFYCHLYIDGVYWGVYQTEERVDDFYGESYFGGDESEYDVIKSTGGMEGYQIEATDGNMDAWADLFEQLDAGVAGDTAYYRAQGLNPDGTRNLEYPVLLDVDNLVDYMIDLFYNGDEDRGLSLPLGNNRPNNFFAIRNRNGEEGFQFFSHDAEQSLLSFHNIGGLYCDRTGPFTGSNQHVLAYSNPQWFHQALMANANYRREFGDRVQELFFNDGLFTPEAVTERFLARASQVELAMIAESARWGDAKRSTPLTQDDWQNALDVLCQTYFPQRTDIVLGQLRADGLYPNVAAPSFSQHGGEVPYGYALAVTNEQGVGETYVTLDGTDPMDAVRGGQNVLVAEDSPIYVLVPGGPIGTGWTGDGTPLDLAGWQSGTGGVGFDNDGAFDPYIGIDLESRMHFLQTTVYVHVPFTVTQERIDALDNLFLSIRADAGYIVYLNGVAIASRFTPAAPAWNSASTSEVNDTAAVAGSQIDVSSFISLLRPGANVLAIHGMNQSALDGDFLVSVGLAAQEPNPYLYTGDPIELTATTTVKSRTLVGNEWSALSAATFTVAPAPAAVVSRGIVYHGSAFGDDPAPDKTPLVPGETADFANYIGYSRGINAITIDIAHLSDADITRTADDFVFRVGNNDAPYTWAAAPEPLSVTVGEGQGVGGSDRVTVVWADAAIANTWLEVRLPAARFGLDADDRFYWGSAIGETGDSAQNALVNVTDLLAIRAGATASATVDNSRDVNKDGAVDALDADVALAHFTGPLGALRLITVAGEPVEGEAGQAAPQSAPQKAVGPAPEMPAIAAPRTRIAPPPDDGAPARLDLRAVDAFFAEIANRHAERVYGPRPKSILKPPAPIPAILDAH